MRTATIANEIQWNWWQYEQYFADDKVVVALDRSEIFVEEKIKEYKKLDLYANINKPKFIRVEWVAKNMSKQAQKMQRKSRIE